MGQARPGGEGRARDLALSAPRPPGPTFPLGSDQYGRDVLSRVLHGARISLVVGLVAVSIAVGVGTPIGLVSGYYGGALDLVLMRLVDVMLAFPGILLALAIVSVLRPSLANLMIAVGIAAACLLIGAGLVQIRDIVAAGSLAPGNAGQIMIADFLTPIIVLMLLVLASGKLRPKSPTTLALEAELENARKAMREYRDALSQLGK